MENHRREAQIFLVETGRVIQTAFPYRCTDFVAITFFTQQVVHLQCYFSCNSFIPAIIISNQTQLGVAYKSFAYKKH